MQHLDEGTLQAWLDGARSGLDPSTLASIGRHIDECINCAGRADALDRSSFRTHALLSVGREEYAPRVSYEDVVKRVRGAKTRDRARRRVAASWAASIVIAGGLGWMSNELYRDAAAAEAETAEAGSLPAVLAEAPPTPVPLVASSGLTALPADADAREDLIVSGFVEDEEGRPVPSAQVYVAELEMGVLTRPDGRYAMRLPSDPGSFELTVQRIGFRQQARAISGAEGDYVAADFRLREEALALDAIVVNGESAAGDQQQLAAVTNSMRASPFVWRQLPSIAVEGYVGSDLWTLPGLDVLTVEVAYGEFPNETHVARVRQDLGHGVTLTMVQGRTDKRRTRWPIQPAGVVGSTWRGEMLITATAPVSADSLRTLLSQIR